MGNAIQPSVQFEKFGRGEPIVETEVLGKKPYLPPRFHITGGTTKYLGLAARRKHQPQHHFYRRAFARPVWSQETENLTPRYLQGEISDGDLAAENLPQCARTDGQVEGSVHRRG